MSGMGEGKTNPKPRWVFTCRGLAGGRAPRQGEQLAGGFSCRDARREAVFLCDLGKASAAER